MSARREAPIAGYPLPRDVQARRSRNSSERIPAGFRLFLGAWYGCAMRRFTSLVALALLLVACGSSSSEIVAESAEDTAGAETNDEPTANAETPRETCNLRDQAVTLAVPTPAAMQLISNDDGCFVLEGDVPGTSPAVVMISAIPLSTHSVASDRLAAEPDGARQYFTQGGMLGGEETIEHRGEETIELLMQNTQAYRLFAAQPEGTDGPRDVTVARVITDEQMMVSVMAVTLPDDEARRARLMEIMAGMIIAP